MTATSPQAPYTDNPARYISADTLPDAVCDAVCGCTRGAYQHSLLRGDHNWGGSSLKGNAKRYGSRYAQSRSVLLERIRVALRPMGWDAGTELLKWDDNPRERRLLVLWQMDQGTAVRTVHVW